MTARPHSGIHRRRPNGGLAPSRSSRRRGTSRVLFLGALLLAAPGAADAFHDGGVASCEGCHVMHDSEDGASVGSGPFLLRFASATDVCLSCHAAGDGSVLGSDPRNPPPERGGGNFTFLLEDDLNDSPDKALHPIGGHRAGHSIVSPAWGLLPDPDHVVAPGGSFPSDQLGCTSCHDPHGTADFRLLRGAGSVLPQGHVFLYDAPDALGLESLPGGESRTNHTAYRGGWSEWCANCHDLALIHQTEGFRHPVDRQLGSEWQTYNAYDGPDNPVGGSAATAYIPDVPFEDPGMTPTSTSGPIGSSRVMCMSCHRAHATSAPASLRWDPNVVQLVRDGVVSLSYAIPDPYDHPEQRSLCVKCHYPEAVDHGMDEPCLSCHRSPPPTAGRLDAVPFR